MKVDEIEVFSLAGHKAAEMGYILFLTKHHDGFCLWDTKTTDRKVTRSVLGRDVLRENISKYFVGFRRRRTYTG